MSDLRKAAQQALEALERYQVKRQDFDRFADEITALRAALAQPESTRSQQMRDAGYTRRPRQLPGEDEQEPVAWKILEGTGVSYLSSEPPPHPSVVASCRPLYPTPPQRKPLAGEELERMYEDYVTHGDIVRAVEKAHGIGVEE
jgi:hypothetical protein